MKKLSPAQQRMMDRLAASDDGTDGVPLFGGGTAASAWHRTAESLHRRGLVVNNRYGRVYLPRVWAEREVKRTAQAVREAQTTVKRRSVPRSVREARRELADAEKAHRGAVEHLDMYVELRALANQVKINGDK